jgi:hypothetical protein
VEWLQRFSKTLDVIVASIVADVQIIRQLARSVSRSCGTADDYETDLGIAKGPYGS